MSEYKQLFINLKKNNINRVYIYGTGKIARELISFLRSNTIEIVGVMDKEQKTGYFEGSSVLSIDAITNRAARVILIASSPKYYFTIYRRIENACYLKGISIWNCCGDNLSIQYKFRRNLKETYRAHISKEEAKKKIEKKDYVSFDIFDTLVMRRTLEPSDVIDILNEKIKKMYPHIVNFNVARKAADYDNPNISLREIYRELKKTIGLTEDEVISIMNEEISLEKSLLVARKEVVEIFEYALSLGKNVFLISDMYMESDILDELLKQCGIEGYDKIYVSCEQGATKTQGLYDIVLKDIDCKKWIHFGDNYESDVAVPIAKGASAVWLLKACDIFLYTDFSRCKEWCKTLNDRTLLGWITSELFNSPFNVTSMVGTIKIGSLRIFGMVFFVPLVVLYITRLIKYLSEDKIDEVLFAARDGWILHQAYEWLREREKLLPEAKYLTISRRIANKLLEGDTCTNVTKKGFLKYLQRENIKLTEHSLFCELYSKGTCHAALNTAFQRSLPGFYLVKYDDGTKFDLDYKAVFERNMNGECGGFWINTYESLMEIFFTSDRTSAQGMDEEGNVVCEYEKRSARELELFCRVKDGILEGFYDYMNSAYVTSIPISKDLVDYIYGMCGEVCYVGECNDIYNLTMWDNYYNHRVNVWNSTIVPE